MTYFTAGFDGDDDTQPMSWVPGLESVAPHLQRDASLHEFLLGPYARVPAHYLSVARLAGGTVLDLGCGDGRLTVRFAQEGFAVLGVDRDAAMLHRLRSKREALPWATRWRIAVHRADFSDGTSLADCGKFAMVMLAGAMISAVPPESRVDFLRGVRAALDSRGCLVFDYCEHDLVRLEIEPVRKYNLTVGPRNGLSSSVAVTQRFASGIEQIMYDSVDLAPDGRVRTHTRATRKHVVVPGGLQDDLAAAGFVTEKNLRTPADHGVANRFMVCRARH